MGVGQSTLLSVTNVVDSGPALQLRTIGEVPKGTKGPNKDTLRQEQMCIENVEFWVYRECNAVHREMADLLLV